MLATDTRKFDVIVIGAGVIGLANAYAAAKRGRSVAVLERSPYASGASIRNFGMIWPIGQPVGERLDIALRSRSIWIELAGEAGFWHHEKGSIYLATHEDELDVIHQFDRASQGSGYQCDVLDQEQVHRRCPSANMEFVIGGMASHTEVGVDPREAIEKTPTLLAKKYGVSFFFDTPVVRCQPECVQTSDRQLFEANEHIVVCSGADITSLYPSFFDQQNVIPCKLQMMSSVAQPKGWDAGPMIASGASMRHYDSFQHCPALQAMTERMDRENPEWHQYGIHFMAAQNALGEMVLGDSHEYGEDITPFNQEHIDNIMLRGLRRYLDLPDFRISRRWHGVYLKSLESWKLVEEIEPGVTAFNAAGGAGMTLSFGLADQYWASKARIATSLIPNKRFNRGAEKTNEKKRGGVDPLGIFGPAGTRESGVV